MIRIDEFNVKGSEIINVNPVNQNANNIFLIRTSNFPGNTLTFFIKKMKMISNKSKYENYENK